MIRRPPRSTPLSLHDALPISPRSGKRSVVPIPPRAKNGASRPVTVKPTVTGREAPFFARSEEHTSELQSRLHLVCRLLLEKKKILRRIRLISAPLAPILEPGG